VSGCWGSGSASAAREGSHQALGCVARVELRGEQSEVPCGESEGNIAREVRPEVRCQPSNRQLGCLSGQQSDKLARAIPKPSERLNHEWKKERVVGSSSRCVLSVLHCFHFGRNAEWRGGATKIRSSSGVHNVNVDIAHDGTEHEFHIGVLIVFGADLKSRLEPRAPTGFRDVSGQESRDLVVPVDTVSRTAGVSERADAMGPPACRLRSGNAKAWTRLGGPSSACGGPAGELLWQGARSLGEASVKQKRPSPWNM